MLSKEKMKKLLSRMSENNLKKNYELMELVFDDIKEVDEYGINVLHHLVEEKYNEEKCFFAVKTLLANGFDPNFEDNCKYNFIQTAIDTGYSENFIHACIKEALNYGLKVNHQEEDGDTIIHTAIRADDYKDSIVRILNLLFVNDYNPHIKNNQGKGIDDLMFEVTKYDNTTKRKLIIELDKILSLPRNLKLGKDNPKAR